MAQRLAEPRRLALGLGALLALPALSACQGNYSILDPAGPAAREVAWLWWIMFVSAMVVTVALVAAWWWAGRRPADELAPAELQRREQRWILWGGIMLPSVAIVALLIYGIPAGSRFWSTDQPASWEVEVTAQQWAWQIGYPALRDTRGLNEIHIPAGEPVDFHIRTQDVIHSFWIPRLGGKIDAIPGRTHVWRLQADGPGTYHGLCAEYCGVGHDHMPLRVIAHAPEDFARWRNQEAAVTTNPENPADAE